MDAKLALLIRVILRRIGGGEDISDVLSDYPKLTEAEKQIVLQSL